MTHSITAQLAVFDAASKSIIIRLFYDVPMAMIQDGYSFDTFGAPYGRYLKG